MKEALPLIDRDYSWLFFNYRVLQEAANEKVPLYERIKFLAIYSSNLDEYFRVRFAALRSIAHINKKKINSKFVTPPKQLLQKILSEVHRQQEEFGQIKRKQIIPRLKENGIYFYRDEPILPRHARFAEGYFKDEILSHLQPVMMTSAGVSEPYLDNRALYFVVDLESADRQKHFAHINIPSDVLPRFIELPKDEEYHYYIALDDIIREHLDFLFPGYTILGCYSIKLNRDADLNIEDEFNGNLVKKIRKQITKRNLGVPSRFLYDHRMPDYLLEYLVKTFSLDKEDLVPGGRYHNMNDLFQLPNPFSPRLENDPWPPLRVASLDGITIRQRMEKSDIMLHFPYQTYDYVLRFFNEAAFDDTVTEIKATFYRIAPESFISNCLIAAARNGKSVTVFVEIKARFDEANNLMWAEKMQQAGIKIIYSIPGLKVHAKVALITRSINDQPRRYAYFGTGNFNEKTAKIYADDALLTTRENLVNELDQLFLYLAGQLKEPSFNHLLVSQFNILDRLNTLIDQEIAAAKEGKESRIILKLNNIEDRKMIGRLYEAARAGVNVQLIVRAICCIVPEENLVIRRIVDRYLEHSRIYYFLNGGTPIIYQGSADWMGRNLHRRIEVVFPILDDKTRSQVMEILRIQLADNVKATLIDAQGGNETINEMGPDVQSQHATYKYLKELDA